MYKINNLLNNNNIKVLEQKGNIYVLEHTKDHSVTPNMAQISYYSAAMNIKKRQVYIELEDEGFVTSSGAMQWFIGDIEASSNIKGVGDFFGKAIKGSITSETASKPLYKGTGSLMLEPTYKYIILEDLKDWGGSMILDDGLFMASQESVKHNITMRTNLSSAVLGNQGLFNLCLSGDGIVALESPVPKNELIVVDLKDDQIKIDGNFAIAWSKTLEFTVEKSTKSLIGSAVSKEGFVNVYRGTGRILLAPVMSYPVETIENDNNIIKK